MSREPIPDTALNRALQHPLAAPLFLGVLYVVSRLVNLSALPMVYDEAIYLRWADIIRTDPSSLFVSAMDGKPPFFFWLNAITLGWFENVLDSARLISVVAGGLAAIGVYRIGALLDSRQTGFLATLIYISLPLVLTHDRLGLTDALLTAFVIWTLYAGLRLAKDARPSWGWALGLGVFSGLGFLTKTPLLMFLVFPVFALALYNDLRNRMAWSRLLFAGIVFAVIALPFLLHEPDYVFSHSSKVLHHEVPLFATLMALFSFDHPRLLPHLRELADVGLLYVTVPVMILALVGLVKGLRDLDRTALFLFLWFILPTAVFLIFAEVAYPRYFLVALPPVALLAAQGLSCLMSHIETSLRPRSSLIGGVAAVVLGVVCLVPVWRWDTHSLTAPETSAWTEIDHWQYVRYPQGPYALADAVRFLKDERRQGPLGVFLTHKRGIPSDALYLYLKEEPGIALYEPWQALPFPHSLQSAQEFVVAASKYQPGDRRRFAIQELKGKRLFFVASTRIFPIHEVLAKNPGLRLRKHYDDIGPYEVFSFAIYERPGELSPVATSHKTRP
ncbi:ArnT family glycosyltransferase [Nitrospina watsonii]|uniref:PMT_2 domain-containing protein n=1 Tax=Nitrospina watsonii TaxID=1323948 RepID=A0ABM9HFY6_9BACT|nr:glycosyltransferase family 39 protein [Nitrospina watsonii]CAI2719143.1 PMT_2 domain-containing protein [Nitrospina watsonii]